MNYTFVCNGMRELHNLLTRSSEAETWKCIWSKWLGDSWERYLFTYGAGVGHLYLKQEPLKEGSHLHDYMPVGHRVQK